MQYDLNEIKKISIVSYLEKQGIEVKKRGRIHMCSSPFSSDSTPSFAIYPTNTFHDFSSTAHGSIIDLVMKLHNVKFREALEILDNGDFKLYEKPKYAMTKKKKKKFSLENFMYSETEDTVKKYAESRRIRRGYVPARFWEYVDETDSFAEKVGMGFIHVDENLKPCGIKIRKTVNENPRFTARGKQMFYIMSNINYEQLIYHDIEEMFWLYVAESESSANSLFEILDANDIPCIVVSFGSVSTVPSRLPSGFIEYAQRSFLVIDYDGNESLYKERLDKYRNLKGLEEKKILFEKKEDINSVYCDGTYKKIVNVLLP